MSDSLCMCYTGRLSRLVNCLHGFYDDVKVNISDAEEISNIILAIINNNKTSTIEEIKKLANKELLERGCDKDTIEPWIENIEI